MPENSFVIIDTRQAKFIDLDIVEVIEDFIIHAPLKKIKVEVCLPEHTHHGFNEKLIRDLNMKPDYIRKHAIKLEKVEAIWFFKI